MKIRSLHLENYRCFDKFDIVFDDDLTVLVGVNGSGKTAVLDAVAAFLQRFMDLLSESDDVVRKIKFDAVNRKMFDVSDLRIRAPKWIICHYTIVEERYRKGQPFSMAYGGMLNKGGDVIEMVPAEKTGGEYCLYGKRGKKGEGYVITEERALAPLLHLYQQCEERTKYPDGRHPQCEKCLETGRCATSIFVQYSPQRSLSTKIEQTSTTAKNRVVFAPDLDFQASFEWFKTKNIAEALKRSDTQEKDYRNLELTVVRDAISQALGNDGNIYEFPHMDGGEDGQSLKLVINHRESGITYEVRQLSDGYRTMLALVIDMARRMAVANRHIKWPEKQSVLHSPGIVLIDEVELHLHPSWQQTVLPKLREIFPCVQFIVTTHSPQVLTTVAAKHIRVLERSGEGFKAEPPEFSPLAHEPGDALTRIMGAQRHPESSLRESIREYEQLVREGRENSVEASGLRKTLVETGYQIHESDLANWRLLAKWRATRCQHDGEQTP